MGCVVVRVCVGVAGVGGGSVLVVGGGGVWVGVGVLGGVGVVVGVVVGVGFLLFLLLAFLVALFRRRATNTSAAHLVQILLVPLFFVFTRFIPLSFSVLLTTYYMKV